MQLTTVIFDMDGLLIDSEPLWDEAANHVFAKYGIQLTAKQYATTTGLRTKEFIQWWFLQYKILPNNIEDAEKAITQKVAELIIEKGRPMPGVEYILNFFAENNFKTGIASSSPLFLINTVIDLLKIGNCFQAISSATELPYGKPHPQVYLNCAEMLQSSPMECVCFEDSFNGMIAAKAARMKCVVVPEHKNTKDQRFNAADLKIASLKNFNNLLLISL
jgi:mannitol-1-/sugar-/sorbitol-6-/2-deoxyglucose-6-phosphatase